MDAVILAGGKCPADVCERTGVQMRAELPVGGKPMVLHVLDAVKQVAQGGVIVVGYRASDCEFAESGSSFVESLRNGLEKVRAENFLLCAADLPFLKSDSLSEFLKVCQPRFALNYPIVPIAECESQFPGMKRTAIKVREGTFTGGNIALANTRLIKEIFPVLEKAYINRKKPLKLAMQVGAITLVRVALGQAISFSLPIAALERNVSKFLGAPVKAVITNRAEIGADIDSLQQYEQAVKLLESKSPA